MKAFQTPVLPDTLHMGVSTCICKTSGIQGQEEWVQMEIEGISF